MIYSERFGNALCEPLKASGYFHKKIPDSKSGIARSRKIFLLFILLLKASVRSVFVGLAFVFVRGIACFAFCSA